MPGGIYVTCMYNYLHMIIISTGFIDLTSLAVTHVNYIIGSMLNSYIILFALVNASFPESFLHNFPPPSGCQKSAGGSRSDFCEECRSVEPSRCVKR